MTFFPKTDVSTQETFIHTCIINSTLAMSFPINKIYQKRYIAKIMQIFNCLQLSSHLFVFNVCLLIIEINLAKYISVFIDMLIFPLLINNFKSLNYEAIEILEKLRVK